MKFWWVHWEEYESGECYGTRHTRELVYADTAEEALALLLKEGGPDMTDDSCDPPSVKEFVFPTQKGVVK